METVLENENDLSWNFDSRLSAQLEDGLRIEMFSHPECGLYIEDTAVCDGVVASQVEQSANCQIKLSDCHSRLN